jgi:hypothetical protein
MKQILLLLLLAQALWAPAQPTAFYVAARTGLSIRETPDPAGKVLDKIPYGTKVVLLPQEEAKKTIVTEGMTGYWEKVTYNKKTGYIVGSYLFPLPPPSLARVKEMKQYLAQVATPFGAPLVLKPGKAINLEDGGYEQRKQLYKNGMEWHRFMGYEYFSDTYFLPEFGLEQGFLLLRLIPEFRELFGEKEEFPTESRTYKKDEREYRVEVEKEVFMEKPWFKRIRIEYDEGAVYMFEMFLLENQLVIFYGAGL